MGILEDYNDDAEKVRTHSLLLTKPKKAEVVPPEDLKVFANTLWVKSEDQEQTKTSIPPVTPTKVGRRSVLDSMKYEPWNRTYWKMKEERAQHRYPDLIRALKREPDLSRKNSLWTDSKPK